MKDIYPLYFKPVLKNYLWGGRNLEKLGRNLPEGEKVAESWEIAAHEDGMTTVKNGPYAGKSLADLLLLLGEDLVGRNNQWAIKRGKFPLLVKLIDANRPLSVQVHPHDDYAMAHEKNELGKSEMWVVLDAEPDAEIVYGMNAKVIPEEFRKAIENGTLEQYLRRIPIRTGDHVCVPAGTLHAILDGVIIAEIQQNSNTTYRVYDWNRLGDDGSPRALHVDKAIDVVDFDQVNCKLPSPKALKSGNGWTAEALCENQYFTTERYRLQKGTTYAGFCDGSSLEIWGVLSGSIEVGVNRFTQVAFFLLPASLGAYEIIANEESTLLRVYVE
jgi:mannose-6-phosphate isomerase